MNPYERLGRLLLLPFQVLLLLLLIPFAVALYPVGVVWVLIQSDEKNVSDRLRAAFGWPIVVFAFFDLLGGYSPLLESLKKLRGNPARRRSRKRR